MEILDFEERFLDACANLYVETFNSAPWNDNWDYETAFCRLKDIYNTPGFLGRVVFSEGRIIAAVMGNIEYWYKGYMYNLKEMFVQQQLRGKKIGSQLLDDLKSGLNNKGVNSIWLLTAEGEMTEKFYLKNGCTKNNGMIMMTKNINHLIDD